MVSFRRNSVRFAPEFKKTLTLGSRGVTVGPFTFHMLEFVHYFMGKEYIVVNGSIWSE